MMLRECRLVQGKVSELGAPRQITGLISFRLDEISNELQN
jgi:hypothetical protein